ncbi:GNAT family N-acetyltransferase [Flavobacterium oncorhynchi]|uniref:GNAT family N-acetyltransferase n=1 Tax=Flavobacterium oncorhynchi TaxID=728056 RepID=A0A226I818_9FLAO|nr:GNAT family N-acetyltransferase [Flavobacterium oncorhynchi]OXB02081.1 GNAT family N-acetyltransferase [Flavobacterium oncorhynchi]
MKKPIETERLLLREVIVSDVDGMFELDSNPNVHIYIGKKPVTTIEQSAAYIENLQQQYKDFGTGRWAVILKETNEFLGWSGIKFITDEINNHKNFYEIGYRFIEKHWGKGYATEAGKAFIEYAFDNLKADAVYAYADAGNDNSRKILEKLGLRYVNSFEYQEELEVWYELKNPNL